MQVLINIYIYIYIYFKSTNRRLKEKNAVATVATVPLEQTKVAL